MKKHKLIFFICLITGHLSSISHVEALDLQGVIPEGRHESTDNIIVAENSVIQSGSNVTLAAYVDTIFKPNFTLKIGTGTRLTIKTIDNDGLSNAWEHEQFGHLDWGPTDDPDQDKFINIYEYYLGFDPEQPATEEERNGDFDGDGYSNFIDAVYGGDPSQSEIKPEFQNKPGVEYSYDALGRIKSISRTK